MITNIPRRTFIKAIAIIGTSMTAAATVGCLPFSQSPEQRLQAALNEIYDVKFEALATGRNASDLTQQLKAKGVITANGNIQTSKLQALALNENLIAFKNFYYSESEIELYALAYLQHI